ncbi:MAG TPA: quinone oxidoreductase [Steroidobacteraceae bacterium]|nr:quinone oxidoreductase [Steroidobacteraceae bacterium]
MSGADRDMGIVVRAAGGPDALEWTALETGTPARGEVLIAQRAIGLNFLDVYFRSGLYPWPSTPLIPGSEAAGIVERLGPDVGEFAVGDRVAYTLPVGAYRQRRIVPADRLVKIPAGVSFESAACLMLKGLTAQYLVTSSFAVRAGHRVLVHAAAGGVGLLLGQWLKLLGATAIGTVGSSEKAAVALENGYAHVIDYRAADFVARVAELSGGAGCDVAYDSVGKDTWRGSLKCLRRRGMFVSFGQSSGTIDDFKLADLAAGGSLFATRPTLFDYIATREELNARAADLFARAAAGELRAHIGQRIALADARAAHEALAGRRTVGATVLLPG